MLTTAAPRPAPRTQPIPKAPKQAPPLRVVPSTPSAAATARGRRVLAALGGLVALLLFGVVVAHVLLMQGQFELERLQQASASEQATYDRLRLRVAELESPDVVVAAAQARLGMVVPTSIRYLAPSPEAVAPTEVPPVEGDDEIAAASVGNDAGVAPPASWATVKPHLGDG